MPSRLRLVCATANAHKVAEIAPILGDAVELIPRPAGVPEVVEDADTLLGNARLKALSLVAATGMAAIADDTGLFIDALGGGPGVHTAYFAGPQASYADNRAKTLAVLDGRPLADRTAQFRTVALICWPDGGELAVEGVCPGVIATEEHEGRGWGYDPLFIPDGHGGRTFSEMTDEEKNAISHRGRAFSALVEALRAAGHIG